MKDSFMFCQIKDKYIGQFKKYAFFSVGVFCNEKINIYNQITSAYLLTSINSCEHLLKETMDAIAKNEFKKAFSRLDTNRKEKILNAINNALKEENIVKYRPMFFQTEIAKINAHRLIVSEDKIILMDETPIIHDIGNAGKLLSNNLSDDWFDR